MGPRKGDTVNGSQNCQTISEDAVEGDLAKSEEVPYKRQIVWKNVVLFIYLHLAALYGLYLVFTSAKMNTLIFGKYYIHILFIIILTGVFSEMVATEAGRVSAM